METRSFGGTGVKVPVVGIGTWQMEGDDRAGAIAAIRAALDGGATHVDTAELYGGGRVEEMVGEAIAGRRDEIFLVSKVRPDNASRQGTVAACERSLRRLGTDRLDCYLLHWEGPHPLADTIAAFEELTQAGKIRSYGVSNFDETLCAEAVALAGPGRIACNQVLYHLGERTIEQAVIRYCEAQGIAVVGYTPFGRHFPPGGKRGARVLEEIAAAHGATPRQVALAFLIRRPSLFAIPKSSHAERVRENTGAAALRLTAAELDAIDRAFAI
jgi:diketogulonate reductase-like aldo/keto reductase